MQTQTRTDYSAYEGRVNMVISLAGHMMHHNLQQKGDGLIFKLSHCLACLQAYRDLMQRGDLINLLRLRHDFKTEWTAENADLIQKLADLATPLLNPHYQNRVDRMIQFAGRMNRIYKQQGRESISLTLPQCFEALIQNKSALTPADATELFYLRKDLKKCGYSDDSDPIKTIDSVSQGLYNNVFESISKLPTLPGRLFFVDFKIDDLLKIRLFNKKMASTFDMEYLLEVSGKQQNGQRTIEIASLLWSRGQCREELLKTQIDRISRRHYTMNVSDFFEMNRFLKPEGREWRMALLKTISSHMPPQSFYPTVLLDVRYETPESIPTLYYVAGIPLEEHFSKFSRAAFMRCVAKTNVWKSESKAPIGKGFFDKLISACRELSAIELHGESQVIIEIFRMLNTDEQVWVFPENPSPTLEEDLKRSNPNFTARLVINSKSDGPRFRTVKFHHDKPNWTVNKYQWET